MRLEDSLILSRYFHSLLRVRSLEWTLKGTRIRFVDPHGMHHGGLSGNREKIEALKELEGLSGEAPFLAKKITMDGYILTQSKIAEIPGAEDKDWPTLERDYRVLQQEGEYSEKLLRVV